MKQWTADDCESDSKEAKSRKIEIKSSSSQQLPWASRNLSVVALVSVCTSTFYSSVDVQ